MKVVFKVYAFEGELASEGSTCKIGDLLLTVGSSLRMSVGLSGEGSVMFPLLQARANQSWA